jgi:hypothetical protein
MVLAPGKNCPHPAPDRRTATANSIGQMARL